MDTAAHGSGSKALTWFLGAIVLALAIAAMTTSAGIGEITEDEPGRVRVVEGSGADIPVDRTGWEHLR